MSLRAHIAGLMASAALSGGIADTYAVEGFSPPVVADFVNEYYRVGGSDSDFDNTVVYTSGDALSTQTDSDGLLKWPAHNVAPQMSSWVNTGGTQTTGQTDQLGGTTAIFLRGNSSSTSIQTSTAVNYTGWGKQRMRAIVKPAGGVTWIWFRLTSSSTWGAYFQLSGAGSVGTTSFVDTANITALSDGWYLLDIEASTALTTTQARIYIAEGDDDFTFSSAPSSSDGLYICFLGIFRSDLGGMVDVPADARVAAGAAFATYVPTTTAAKYLARRGNHVYNGTSFVNKGLLLETEARTNTLAYSNDFSTSWSISAAGSLTITANNSTGPDGNSSLHKIAVTDATSEAHILFDTVTTTSGVTHCFSAVFEDNDQQFVCLEIYDSTNRWVAAVFDVQNKTVTQESVGVNDSVLVGAGIIDLGGGLYRCWVSGTISNGDENGQARIMFVDSGTPTLSTSGVYSYAGTGGEYLNGGFTQFEVGSSPSSIIPTSGATVTRPAQALSIPAANMSYSATAMSVQISGTITVANPASDYDVNPLWSMNSTAFNNSWYIRLKNQLNRIDLDCRNDDATLNGDLRFFDPSTGEINGEFNVASRVTETTGQAAINGVSGTEVTGKTEMGPDAAADCAFFTPNILDTMLGGNLTLYRQWDDNITETGIETAST
jgi:hypothetical protein